MYCRSISSDHLSLGAGNDPSKGEDGLDKGSTVSKAKIHPMDRGKKIHAHSIPAAPQIPIVIELHGT